MKLLPDLLPEPAFDDRFVRALPADPEPRNFVRQVRGAAFSKVKPTPVPAPRMLAWAPEVAELLDVPPALMQRQEMADVLGGNALLPGMVPYAAHGEHKGPA